jgi:RloB-like protein
MPNRPSGRARRGTVGFTRETNLARRFGTREQRTSVLVVTNGIRTEKAYFDALGSEPWVAVNKVKVKPEEGSPAAVVQRAAEIRDGSEYDEAWVVCDADDFDVRLAASHARRHAVKLAVSVPCFEVWLILHLAPGCPGFNDAGQAGDHLKRLLRRWDKTALRFADFRDGVFDAVTRAKRLEPPPEGNPATDVWRLIEALQTASERA